MTELAQRQYQSTGEVFGSFLLADSEFAIPASAIRDVINVPDRITRQPLAPSYLLGIFTLRDMTVPVIDLREMFNLSRSPEGSQESAKVAILEYGDYQIGLLFDQTSEVFRRHQTGCQYSAYSDSDEQSLTSGACLLYTSPSPRDS